MVRSETDDDRKAGTAVHPRELRSSLNKAAFVLALRTSRHPGSVNRELNGVMGVDRRAEATKDAGVTFSGDPPF